MRTSALLLVLGLSFQPLRAEQNSLSEANPLRVTIPSEKAADSKDLPQGALLRLGSSRMPRAVSGTFAFSPDGKYLVYGLINKSAEVREVETGRIIQRFGPFPYAVDGAFVSPDSKMIAIAAGISCFLFDMTTGKQIAKLERPPTTEEVGSYFLTVGFSPDGKLVCTGSPHGTLAVWDRQTGDRLNSFTISESSVRHLAISPDSLIVAGADWLGTIKAWTLPTGKPVPNTFSLKSEPRALRFEDAGKLLMAVGTDDGLHRWDVKTGEERAALPEIKGGIAMSPDGTLLASFQADRAAGPIVFWDRKTGKVIGKIPDKIVSWAAMTSDNRALATYGADGLMRLWEIPSGKEINPPQGHLHRVTGVVFSNDGKTIISGSEDDTVRFWDRATGRERKRLTAKDENIHALALSGDGKTLVLAGGSLARRDGGKEQDKPQSISMHFWDVEKGEETKSFVQTGPPIRKLRFTADDRRIWSTSWTDIQFIDVKTGEAKFAILTVGDGILAADITADGRYLTSINAIGPFVNDHLITYADLVSRKEIVIKGIEGFCFDLASAPDGKALAVARESIYDYANNSKTNLQLWSIPGGQVVRNFDIAGGCTSLTFSRDGRMLAAAQGEGILVFEVSTGKIRRSFTGHENRVQTLAFSRDNRQLVSGGDDCRIFVWDNTGRDVKKMATEFDVKEMNLLWNELLSEDAGKANEAIWSLVERPADSLTFLKTKFELISNEDRQRLEKLITQLDDNRFAIRRRAALELEKLGGAAGTLLEQALGQKSPEVGEAAKRLLEKIGNGEDPVTSPEARRMVRAVEALEYIGNAEAKSMLKELKQRGRVGQREAAAALQRLK